MRSGMDFPLKLIQQISVYQLSPGTNDPGIMDMNDYLIFGTEYGLVPWDKVKGRKIDELPPEILDSLLLNVKSNWINWRTILSDDLPVFKYPGRKR